MPRGDELDALIARAQGGDLPAFEALLEGHLQQVRRFARAFARSDADADDLAQEALIKVFRNLRHFRYQAAFGTWVYSVVRNAFLDAARSSVGRARSREESLAPLHLESLPAGAAADEALLRAQERERLWRALRQVPPEFRAALVLFDIEGCSYDEVAAVEGVPVGTIKSRLSRGRAHLKKLLEADGEGPPEESSGTSGEPPASNAGRRVR